MKSGSRQPTRRAITIAVAVAFLMPGTLLVMAGTAPRVVADPNPFAATDALTLAMLAEDEAAAWDEVLDPAWRAADPEALQAFLEAHYEPATDTFTFTGPTAANDALVARAMLDQIHLAQQFAQGQQEDVRAVLEQLILTGTLPDGWSDVPEAGAPAAAPAQQQAEAPSGEQAPTPEQLAQAPLPPRFAPSPEGPEAQADPDEQVHFFIDSCPNCDKYLFGGNVISATFDLGPPHNITPDKIEEASLDISAFDVDWGSTGCPAGPERDAVQLNGNFVGYLTGADSTWSTSSYNLDPGWFVAGVNTVSVVIDSTGTGCWAVTVDWFDVTVNKPVGPVNIIDHTTNKDAYNFGDAISVETTILTREEGPYSARVEWNLVQPDGNIVQTLSASATLQKDTPLKLPKTLTIPGQGKEGGWTVVAIAYDKDGAKSDEDSKIVQVGTDLVVEPKDIEVKVEKTNPQSGIAHVKVTIKWHLQTKVTDPQKYTWELYLHEGGQRRYVDGAQRSDTAGTFDIVRFFDVKPGAKVEMILDTGSEIKETKEDNNKAEKSLCSPIVKEATPKIKGSYFEKVELKNEWKAKTDAVQEGCPDIAKVVYDFDGSKVESTLKDEEWKAEFDMGKMSNGWNRPLKVYAVDKDGNQGDPWETKLRIWKMPEFMVYGWKGPIGRQGVDFSISINGEYATFKFAFNKTVMQGKVNVPTSIPVLGDKIGGEWGGTVEFGVEGEVTTKGDTFKLKGYLKGDGKAGNKAKAFLKGTLSGDFKNPAGDVGWYLAKLTVSVEGGFTSPPIPLYKIIGFEVTFTISISVTGNFVFSENGSPKLFGLGWDHFNFSVRIGLGIRALLGDEKVVGLSAGLEGGVKPTFLIPPPKFLKDVVFDVKFEVKGHFLGWEKKVFGVSWEATYVAGDLRPVTPFELPERSWQRAGYASFVATGPDGPVIDKMYPWANPETASNSLGQMLTVYTHDVPGQPRPQSYDAWAAHFDGQAWSPAEAISSTAHPDFDPAVALDDSGLAAAVWMRFEDTGLPESTVLPEIVDIVDLYYSTWTEAAGWAAPQALTDDGVVQLMQSVTPDAGGFLAAWASDASNVILTPSQLDLPLEGRIELPTRDLHVARIAPGVPPTPVITVATDVALAGLPRVAPLGSGAFLVAYAVDGDGDARTRDDVRLLARTATLAGGLGAPVVVAQGTVKDPTFAQGAALPLLAWVGEVAGAEEQVVVERPVASVDLGLGLPAVSLGEARTLLAGNALYPIINSLAVRLDAATQDRIVTWTGASEDGEGQQVFSALVPASGGQQDGSAPAPAVRALTPAGEMAWRAGVALSTGADGARTLRAAYMAVDSAGEADLASASRVLRPDAALEDLQLSAANPAPGTPVTVGAVLRNDGDAPLPPVQVQLLDNGAVAGAVMAPPLAPGAQQELNFAWLVPQGDQAHVVRVVADPGAIVAELDEANNAQELTTVLPALGITALADVSGAAFKVEARLANTGARVAPAGTATLVLEDTGEVLGSFAHGALAPGAAIILHVTPDPALLPAEGAFVALRITPLEDFDLLDNEASAFVASLPDLALAPQTLVLGSGRAGPVTGTVEVRNLGTSAAPATVLRVERDDVVVGEAPVPALDPGTAVEVRFDFEGLAGEHAYFVRAGLQGERDADPGNNGVGRTLRFQGLPDGDVSVASLAFEGSALRVTVFNRGDGDLPLMPFQLYNGVPVKVPKYGLKYRTQVDTLVGRGSVANVPAHGAASVLLPAAALDLAQIPANGRLWVWLDPDLVTQDSDRANDQGSVPMFSARSTTHPDPRAPGTSSTAAFSFGARPGLALGGVSYVLDNAAGTVPDTVAETTNLTASFPNLANGAWWLHARGLVAGAWRDPVHVPILVNANDALAPATTLLLDGPWVRSGAAIHVGDRVPLRLDAREGVDGVSGVSGLAGTEVAVDGAWRPYAGPFSLAGEGLHVVQWRSRDLAGNVEATRTQSFVVEVDIHAPVTTVRGALERGGGLFIAPGAPLTLLAEEPAPYLARFGSGVAGTQVRVDGGPWQPYAQPLTFAAPDALHTLEFASVDRDGNAEAVQVAVVSVDGTAPALDVTSHEPDALVAGPATFVVEAADAGVGLARIEVRREGALVAALDVADGTHNLTLDTGFWTFGNNHLAFRAIDRWGNAAEVPLTVYVVSRNVALWKDPLENLDRYLPGPVRAEVPL